MEQDLAVVLVNLIVSVPSALMAAPSGFHALPGLWAEDPVGVGLV